MRNGERRKMDTLVNKIIDYADSQPDKLAVGFKRERVTYGELYHLASGIAEELTALCIGKGDRVCFSAVSRPEMAAVYLAVQMCGAVAVFLDKNALPENMAAIYEECGGKILLTDKPMKEFSEKCQIVSLRKIYQEVKESLIQAETVPEHERIAPEEEALSEILFTTGTTGKPKGVMLTYRAVYNILRNTIDGIGIREDEVLLLPLPLNHSFALRVLRAVLYQGATIVLQNGFTFARESENNIQSFHCTAMACVPASYEVMKSQMQDAFARVMGRLRYIEFGAGSLTLGQRKEITSLIPDVQIWNTWGSSESGGAIFCNVSEIVKSDDYAGTLGRPLEGRVEVRTLDSEGKPFISDAEHPGRMALRGGMEMSGYWNNAEATGRTLADGWLITGDMVYVQDGYVFMLGRADDLINVGGEKVSPVEVENMASTYSGIRECACIGAADPKGTLGQIPVLFYVSKAGCIESELLKFLSERMERYKLPQEFVRMDEIPRNRMQKIDRRALKLQWERRNEVKTETELMNPVVETILSRRSIRKFTDQEIPEEVLQMILRCGYHAPSGHNMQTWRFTVLRKRTDIERLKEAVHIAAEAGKVPVYGFENPKVLVLVSNDMRNPDGCQDASCAAENMMLAAGSYGIGSVWLNPLMTLRGTEPVKSLLDEYGIPENHAVWAMVALGYALTEGTKVKKKENVVTIVS